MLPYQLTGSEKLQMLHIEKGNMMGHGHISPNTQTTQTTKSTTTSNEVSYTAEGFTKNNSFWI